ncbi:MAG: hypothetical protein KFW09_03005 [Oscillospiraceae bacterium]|nr:hypothetical protein [Oscillospiraceae bacterium]
MEIKKLRCRKKIKPRVLIGSVIRQNSKLLQHFLLSIEKLNIIGIDVDYYIIDDNISVLSSSIIKNFKDRSILKGDIIIENSTKIISMDFFQTEEKYIPLKHNWNKEMLDRIYFMKHRISKYALNMDYDYVFLLDSDVIIHRNTLYNLISKEKDIISTLIVSRYEDDMTLINAWLHNDDKIYLKEDLVINKDYQSLFNIMTETQKNIKVGYLSDCILISKNALENGIDYSLIKKCKNIPSSYHIFIKSYILGYEVFLDNSFPGYHIYNEYNLEIFEKAFLEMKSSDRILDAIVTPEIVMYEIENNTYDSYYLKLDNNKSIEVFKKK